MRNILTVGNITALPIVHGRLPFAMEVRRQLLEQRYEVLAIELPASLREAVITAIAELPKVGVVIYRERPAFLDPDDQHVWYVPIDPCDAIIEALRIAHGERTRIEFIDAEVEEFHPRPVNLPDAHAITTIGLEQWYRLVSPHGKSRPRTDQDRTRDAHMAARLRQIADTVGQDRKILFICGLAHWRPVRAHLEAGTGTLHPETGPDPSLISSAPVHPHSLVHLLGEIPHLTWLWEQHRTGWEPGSFDPVQALKDLLLDTRTLHEKEDPESLEKATPQGLRALLTYLRKLVVGAGRLMPDTWSLAVAAKGTIGNDYAVKLIEATRSYPPNEGLEDALLMTGDEARIEDALLPASSRTPGEAREFRALRLVRKPSRKRAAEWQRGWNPQQHCSWPPEDVVIEQFRAYVTRRALTLAGMSLRRTEPFIASFKDGIAIRESLRDWHLGKIHVKEEPPVAGDVGALVTIFEEDDDGTRFPWRATWMAEHDQESTLAFYATDPAADMVGPGLGRMFYGGCMFLYPPIMIPDVWDDLHFEQARRPSERLLLAALHYSREKFIAYLGPTPPAPEVREQAAVLHKHIVYLPLTQFSHHTLEKMRRAHVLNGRQVRSWASRFI